MMDLDKFYKTYLKIINETSSELINKNKIIEIIKKYYINNKERALKFYRVTLDVIDSNGYIIAPTNLLVKFEYFDIVNIKIISYVNNILKIKMKTKPLEILVFDSKDNISKTNPWQTKSYQKYRPPVDYELTFNNIDPNISDYGFLNEKFNKVFTTDHQIQDSSFKIFYDDVKFNKNLIYECGSSSISTASDGCGSSSNNNSDGCGSSNYGYSSLDGCGSSSSNSNFNKVSIFRNDKIAEKYKKYGTFKPKIIITADLMINTGESRRVVNKITNFAKKIIKEKINEGSLSE